MKTQTIGDTDRYMVQGEGLPHPTKRRIELFAQMDKGWDYGKGLPFASGVVSLALRVHKAMVANGFYSTDAFPSPSGEIVVTLYSGNNYVEMEVRPDLLLNFTWERDDVEVVAAEDLKIEDAERYLKQLREESWKLSASSTPYTTTTLRSASTARPSGNRALGTEGATRLSVLIASTLEEERSVSTFAHTTPKPEARHRYTGGFLPEFCPMGTS